MFTGFSVVKVARLWVVCIGIGLMLFLNGCGRKQPQQLVPNPNLPPPAPTVPNETDPEAAKNAVIEYLQALYAQDYHAAHELLSVESQKLHSPEVLAQAAQESHVMYDLGEVETRECSGAQAEVVVALQAEEEPGHKEFTLEKEAGEWKVVYLKGGPFFPYAE